MITNKEHFNYFKKRTQYWLNKLCLNGWDVQITNNFVDNSKNGCTLGSCWRNNDSKMAIINLSKDWMGEPIKKPMLNQVALHECLELLLCEMAALIFCRELDGQRVEPAMHTVIQSLLKALLENKEVATRPKKRVKKVRKLNKTKVQPKQVRKSPKKK